MKKAAKDKGAEEKALKAPKDANVTKSKKATMPILIYRNKNGDGSVFDYHTSEEIETGTNKYEESNEERNEEEEGGQYAGDAEWERDVAIR